MHSQYQRYPLGKKYRSHLRSVTDLLDDTYEDNDPSSPWDSFMSLEQFAGLSDGNLSKYRLENKRRYQLREQAEPSDTRLDTTNDEDEDNVCRDLFGRMAAYKDTVEQTSFGESPTNIREFPSMQHLQYVLKGSDSLTRQKRQEIMSSADTSEQTTTSHTKSTVEEYQLSTREKIGRTFRKWGRRNVLLEKELDYPLRECATTLEDSLMELKYQFSSRFIPDLPYPSVVLKRISRQNMSSRTSRVPVTVTIREMTAHRVFLTIQRTSKILAPFYRSNIYDFIQMIEEKLSSHLQGVLYTTSPEQRTILDLSSTFE